MRHYSSSERMHRLSVIYAIVGLLFGCLAAGLIVASARQVSRPVVHITTWMEQVEPTSTATMATVGRLRAHRRLTDDAGRTSKTFTNFERTLTSIPAPVIPTVNPASSPPTSYPVDKIEPATKVSDGETTTSVVATETVAAAMVGVASSLIVCALICYASDLRDRYHHEKWATEQRHQVMADDNSTQKSVYRSRVEGESQTSAGSTHQESGYTYWVQVTRELVEYQGDSRKILPPLLLTDDAAARDENYLALTLAEDNSISRVSTLTASFVEGGFASHGSFSSYDDIEEKLGHRSIESSEDVTELSDSHRVSDDTPLASLIKCDVSNCSPLTNGSQSTVSLLGEECLDIKFHQTPDTTSSPFSLEVSPDTPFIDDDGVISDYDAGLISGENLIDESDELAQLDQIVAGIPFDDEMSSYTPMHDNVEGRNDVEDTREEPEESSHVAFVRQVCFVPCATASFGLELQDASSAETYPTVSKVYWSGPLAGRLFLGDAILAVNDHDTCGLCSEEIMKLFKREGPTSEHSTKMIALKVMSSESDGGSLSDEQQSIDLDSAVEV